MATFWLHTPSDHSLSAMRAWAQPDKNLFAAIRHHLLVVARKDGQARNGPASAQIDLPMGATLRLEEKLARNTKFTHGIQESVTSSVTAKLSQEVFSKAGWGAGASTAELSASISVEIGSRIETELQESLQSSLAVNSAYEIQVSEERMKALEIKVEEETTKKRLMVYPKLHLVTWDFYLYSTDYLQLEYKRHRFWHDVRQTIRQGEIPFRAPLFSISFYEPEEDLSYTFESYTPEVADGAIVTGAPLNTKCPPATLQIDSSLEEIARIAFPTAKEERATQRAQAAARPRGGLLPGRPARSSPKASAAKKSAARPAAKKAAAKKSAARPAAKKAAAKPAAK